MQLQCHEFAMYILLHIDYNYAYQCIFEHAILKRAILHTRIIYRVLFVLKSESTSKEEGGGEPSEQEDRVPKIDQQEVTVEDVDEEEEEEMTDEKDKE